MRLARANIAQKKKGVEEKGKGLKLLISMPVDSFDDPGPCLSVPPFLLLCAFLPPGSGQKWV